MKSGDFIYDMKKKKKRPEKIIVQCRSCCSSKFSMRN